MMIEQLLNIFYDKFLLAKEPNNGQDDSNDYSDGQDDAYDYSDDYYD